MKRIYCLICVLALALCACGSPTVQPGPQVMFGIDWSVTPEQVREALDLPKGDLLGGILTVFNRDFFGAESEKAEFQFLQDAEGQLRLCFIRVIYPENADMARVLKKLEKAYGPSVSSFEMYVPNKNATQTVTATDHLAFWHSDKTLSSLGGESGIPLAADRKARLEKMLTEPDDPLTAYHLSRPLVRLFWTDDGQIPYLDDDQPKNAVYLDASLLASMR